jgi:hypothetical protein
VSPYFFNNIFENIDYLYCIKKNFIMMREYEKRQGVADLCKTERKN